MRLLTFILVLIFYIPSLASVPDWCYERKVQTVFVNGMLVDRKSARYSINKLKNLILVPINNKLKNFYLQNYFEAESPKLLYNYHMGKVNDAVEAYIQLCLESGMTFEEARKTLYLWLAKLNNIAIPPTLSPIYQLFFDKYLDKITEKQVEKLTEENYGILLKNYQEHKEKLQEWLNKGYPVILVAHSQGNFFANAYADNGWLQPSDNSAPPPVVRVLHLATPATKLALEDGKAIYYTASEDLVIAKFVRFASDLALDIQILPPNISLNCGSIAVCPFRLHDPTLHSFVNTYLNENYPPGNSMRSLVRTALEGFMRSAVEEWYSNLIGAPGSNFYEFEKLALNGRCPVCGIDPTKIAGRQIDPPRIVELDCSNNPGVAMRGGYQVTTFILDTSKLPKNSSLNFYFEPYYIPDSICISHPPGNEIYKRIKIGRNAGTPDLPINESFQVNNFYGVDPLKSKVVVIIVGEDPQTAWDFEIGCQ